MRSGFTALHRLNRDGAIDPVNLGKRSRKRFLGQSRRADNGEGRSTSQNDLCDFHSSLPVFEICAISRNGPDWFLRRKTRRYAPAEGGFDDLQGEDTPNLGYPTATSWVSQYTLDAPAEQRVVTERSEERRVGK